MKTEQLIDCEGITLESNKPFAFSCCDCGLTHHMVIVSEDGKPVGFAVKRVAATPPGGAGDGLDEAAFLERFERNVEVRNDHCAAILAVGAGGSVGAVPEGYALVPVRLTQEMDDVIANEGWQWEDLLAAAGAITLEQYDEVAATPATEQAAPAASVPAGGGEAERAQAECDAITELNHAQWLALENVRTLASRHRKEEWAQHMLRFCDAAGNAAQTFRAAPLQPQDGKDARTDSVHLGSGASGEVHAPGPTDAPRWQVGTWTLTAPDGRTWQADSPLKACSDEQRDRIPAEVALKRIFDACDNDHDWQPIETAPKDGTRVILSWGGKSINGFYLDNSRTSTPWAGWRVESMVAQPAGRPTHWQPFPDALSDAAIQASKGSDRREGGGGGGGEMSAVYSCPECGSEAAPVSVVGDLSILRALLVEWLDGMYDGPDFLRRVKLAVGDGLKLATKNGEPS